MTPDKRDWFDRYFEAEEGFKKIGVSMAELPKGMLLKLKHPERVTLTLDFVHFMKLSAICKGLRMTHLAFVRELVYQVLDGYMDGVKVPKGFKSFKALVEVKKDGRETGTQGVSPDKKHGRDGTELYAEMGLQPD
jgi:hypothetical protein